MTTQKPKIDRSKYMFTDKKNETLIKHCGELEGFNFKIRNLENCIVYLLDWTTGMFIDDCVNCEFLLSPCDGSIFIRTSKNCTVSVISKQLRFRDCEDCRIYAYCTSDPVIEASKNILFAPFNYAFPKAKELFLKAKFEMNENKIDKVYDFSGKAGDAQMQFRLMEKGEFEVKYLSLPAIDSSENEFIYVNYPKEFECLIDENALSNPSNQVNSKNEIASENKEKKVNEINVNLNKELNKNSASEKDNAEFLHVEEDRSLYINNNNNQTGLDSNLNVSNYEDQDKNKGFDFNESNKEQEEKNTKNDSKKSDAISNEKNNLENNPAIESLNKSEEFQLKETSKIEKEFENNNNNKYDKKISAVKLSNEKTFDINLDSSNNQRNNDSLTIQTNSNNENSDSNNNSQNSSSELNEKKNENEIIILSEAPEINNNNFQENLVSPEAKKHFEGFHVVEKEDSNKTISSFQNVSYKGSSNESSVGSQPKITLNCINIEQVENYFLNSATNFSASNNNNNNNSNNNFGSDCNNINNNENNVTINIYNNFSEANNNFNIDNNLKCDSEKLMKSEYVFVDRKTEEEKERKENPLVEHLELERLEIEKRMRKIKEKIEYEYQRKLELKQKAFEYITHFQNEKKIVKEANKIRNIEEENLFENQKLEDNRANPWKKVIENINLKESDYKGSANIARMRECIINRKGDFDKKSKTNN